MKTARLGSLTAGGLAVAAVAFLLVGSISGLCLVGCAPQGAASSASTENSSATNVTASSLGQPPTEEVPLASAESVSEDSLGKRVTVEGRVTQQCPAVGCWFRVQDETGEVFVDLNPSDLRLSGNRKGQRARVTGRVGKTGGRIQLEAEYVQFESGAAEERAAEPRR